MMNESNLMMSGALQVFGDFTYPDCQCYKIEHDLSNKKYSILKQKYPINDVADIGTNFSQALNLMRWVYDNVWHNGCIKNCEDIPKNSISLLDYSFGKGVEYGLYCRHQAIIFTECCLSIGLIARTIHCKPFSPYDFDSHIVSMVYINELNKWVLFDPTNNAYFKDKQGVALSPLETRYLLGINEIEVNEDFQPRNNIKPEIKENEYKYYMAKNLFYIKYWAKNTFGTDLVKNQITYYLIPKGFNVKGREITFNNYVIKTSDEISKKYWEQELNNIKRKKMRIVSKEQFLQK